MFMLIFAGWVVPAAGQAARTRDEPGRNEHAPARGVAELTTSQLVFDPDRATVFAQGTYSARARSASDSELNNAGRAGRAAACVALAAVARLQPAAPTVDRTAAVDGRDSIGMGAFIVLLFLGFRLETEFGSHPASDWLPSRVLRSG